MAVGEEAHLKGMDGVRRARLWLENTMRISNAYANTDAPAWAEKLTLAWPMSKQTFSFDLGGMMRGDEYEGHTFCAEVKNYAQAANQGTEFPAFLAKCYVARSQNYFLGDHFMWITWAPFLVTSWSTLNSPERVVDAVVTHRSRIFGDVSEEEARDQINDDVAASVAKRLWLIVLSQKQETLVPLLEWQAIVASELRRLGARW